VKVSYEETGRRVDALTDHQAFERLVTILLARTGLNVRLLGGSGDRDRDAVVGLRRADAGEDLAITISLNTSWAAKIRSDVELVHSQGFKPSTVISVTTPVFVSACSGSSGCFPQSPERVISSEAAPWRCI
jgi:Restriction endonuclease